MALHPNYERLRNMSDEMLKSVWFAIQDGDRWDREAIGDEWIEDVYSEMSNRGLSALNREA